MKSVTLMLRFFDVEDRYSEEELAEHITYMADTLTSNPDQLADYDYRAIRAEIVSIAIEVKEESEVV